jgi:hypothetical protein
MAPPGVLKYLAPGVQRAKNITPATNLPTRKIIAEVLGVKKAVTACVL